MAHIYKPEESWDAASFGFPSALAIGDSWFWYVNNNILGTLVRHPALSDDHRNVQLVGYNGAKLRDYVGGGKYADTVEHFLRPGFVEGFSEFYISGAGNDAVDYDLALRADCSTAASAADCIDERGMDDMLFRLRQSLQLLISNIRYATRHSAVQPPVFLNGYDYPVPDGRGFEFVMIRSGPWLAPAMDRRRVAPDPARRAEIARLLIDRLNDDVLAPLALAMPDVEHIDSRGTLPRDGHYRDAWANELHPTSHGFRLLFEKAWLPKLFKRGIALRSVP